MKGRLILASLLIGLAGYGGVQAQAAETTTVATPYRESELSNLKQAKQVSAGKTITLDLVLKTRNSGKLTSTALAVNTEGNKQFKKYLTPK